MLVVLSRCDVGLRRLKRSSQKAPIQTLLVTKQQTGTGRQAGRGYTHKSNILKIQGLTELRETNAVFQAGF